MKTMKTMVKITLVIAFLMAANSLFAAGNLKVSVLPVSSENVLFSITSLANSDLDISVSNARGIIVYTNQNAEPSDNNLVEFNLNDLPDGKYNMKVISHDLTLERKFLKSDNGIKLGKEKTFMMPYFGLNDEMLRCTYLNFSGENVRLYFLKGKQLLYSKELGNFFNISEGLNISKLGEGTYEVILSAGGKDYSFKVNK